jgi:hypothetical protein
MNRINSSYLKFYIIATSSVVILFSVVTAYGEKNLNPPPRISGSYKIESANLPDCLKDKPLQLMMQQSGVYLSASLQLNQDGSENKSKSEKNPPLKGRWQDGKFSIAGSITEIEGCDRTKPLTITAAVIDKKLEGKIAFSSNTSDFTAQIQEPDSLQDASRRKPTVNH